MKTCLRSSSARIRASSAAPEQPVAERAREHPRARTLQQELAQLGRRGRRARCGRGTRARARSARRRLGQEAPPLGRAACRSWRGGRAGGRPPSPRCGAPARQLLGRQRLAVDVAEEALDLPRAEAQVVRAELEQVTGDAQAREVDVGPPPGRREHAHLRREVHDEALELALGRRAPQQVQVVEAQHERLLPALERAAGVVGGSHSPGGRSPIAVSQAARNPLRKRAGDASDGSAAYHALLQPASAASWASRVDLPAPAGATTSTSRCCAPPSHSVARRSRRSACGLGVRGRRRGGGSCSVT